MLRLAHALFFQHSVAGLQVQAWKNLSGLMKHSKIMRNPENSM